MNRLARTYVSGVVALAAVVVAFAATAGPHLDLADTAPRLVGFAVAMLLVQLLPVPFPRGSQLELIRVDEAVVVPLVLILDPLPALIAVAGGVLAGQLLGRAERTKALFNAAQMTVAVGAAVAITAAISGSTSPGYGTLELLAATAGLLAMFAINQLLVAGVLRVAAGAKVRDVLGEDLPLKAGMWVANACLGMLLVLPAIEAPGVLLLAFVPLGMLHAAWRVHAERARDEQRLRELGSAVGDMSGGLVSMENVARQLTDAAREVVEADGAEVRLFDSDQVWWSRRTEQGITQGARPLGAASAVAEDEATRVSFTVPLTGGQGPLGELVVWTDRERDGAHQHALGRRDRTLLEMLVAQATAAFDNAVLVTRSGQQQRTITQVFEHSSEGMLVLDRRGRVRGWNPAMQSMSGFGMGTVDASPISLLSQGLGSIVEATGPGTLDAEISTADGTRRTIRASFAPIDATDEHGDDEPSWVVVVRDVSLEHETERLKDDFVATVSHELRTPLTAIKGFVETMRREDVDLGAAQVRMFLQIMGEQADRLERLIGDLLDMSAIESGRPLEVDLTPVDLGTSVRRAIGTFEAARPTAEVSLTDLEVGLVVDADAHRLEQVLTNLMDNAIKHGDGSPHVDVAIGRDAQGHATIAVTDRGPGISAVDQRRIFERFFVTADSVTRTGGGAGLGLYICHKLVGAMDGHITVGSQVGEGTTFTIVLPVLAASLPRPERTEHPASVPDPHAAQHEG